jgi:hypothetical protein
VKRFSKFPTTVAFDHHGLDPQRKRLPLQVSENNGRKVIHEIFFRILAGCLLSHQAVTIGTFGYATAV